MLKERACQTGRQASKEAKIELSITETGKEQKNNNVIDAKNSTHKISFRVRLAYAIYFNTHRRVHSKTLSLLLLSLAGTAALKNSYSSMRARYSSVLDIIRA
jgi:hypothetical protein